MTDPVALRTIQANIDALLTEMREGLHGGDPLREQIRRILALAEQYDLAGMHDAAQRFRSNADALVPLRDWHDRQDAEKAERAARRQRRRRVLTFGLAQRGGFSDG